MIIYQSALIPGKLPCPKKFLVRRLKLQTGFIILDKAERAEMTEL